jgi:hypothetical protein|tara:strand:+ start:114 stop:731 length:618 start_codon:yes stop_codon:yes gene_type:complete
MKTYKEFLAERKNKNITINFFDIDETVFNTFAMIVVRDKNTKKEITQITNKEFNDYQLKDNEEFDFSQFLSGKLFKTTSKVINSTLKQVKDEFSEGNMIVFLTARPKFDDNKLFKDKFREVGLKVNDKRIRFELSGNLKKGTIASRKEYIMRKYLSSFDVSVVKIWDDHVENVKIADKLANEYESVKFMKYLIVNGRIKYLGTLN